MCTGGAGNCELLPAQSQGLGDDETRAPAGGSIVVEAAATPGQPVIHDAVAIALGAEDGSWSRWLRVQVNCAHQQLEGLAVLADDVVIHAGQAIVAVRDGGSDIDLLGKASVAATGCDALTAAGDAGHAGAFYDGSFGVALLTGRIHDAST